MIEFLKKLSDEGIKVSIDTTIHGMMKVTLTHRNNHSSYLDDLKKLVQYDSPDDAFTEFLYHTYDELKEFEARQNDL
nr:MAG TPA: hypothetical protein [Caudoviricetes sp.]